MTKLKLLFLAAIVVVTQGCANVAPDVSLQSSYWQNKNQKVAVANTRFDAPDYYISGYHGLLDVARTVSKNSELIEYLKNTDIKWYDNLSHEFKTELDKKGIVAKVYADKINLKDFNKVKGKLQRKSEYDFSPLLDKVKARQLLLVELKSVGVEREYHGPIPKSDLKTMCKLEGRLVDLQSNKVLWRKNVHTYLPLGKNKILKQPLDYQNISDNLSKTVKTASTELLGDFFEDAS